MKSRIAAAVVIGILFGSYTHHDHLNWQQRGRDVFVAFQINRFDKFYVAPHPWLVYVIAAVFVTMFFLGLYELIVFLFSKVLDPKPPGNVANSHGSLT